MYVYHVLAPEAAEVTFPLWLPHPMVEVLRFHVSFLLLLTVSPAGAPHPRAAFGNKGNLETNGAR